MFVDGGPGVFRGEEVGPCFFWGGGLTIHERCTRNREGGVGGAGDGGLIRPGLVGAEGERSQTWLAGRRNGTWAIPLVATLAWQDSHRATESCGGTHKVI